MKTPFGDIAVCDAYSHSISKAFVGVILLLVGCTPPADRNDSAEDQILEERVREYFDERFHFYPVEATGSGLHAYDGELGQFGASHLESRVLQLRDLRQRLLGIDLTRLSEESFVDALWLTSAIKAELFELEEIQTWRRSPGFYSEILCRGVSSLLEPWDPPRVEALLSRLDQVPVLLRAAIDNLDSPSPLAIEEGLADLRKCQASIAELPSTLAGFLSDALGGEIQRATRAAQEPIQDFISYLESNAVAAEPDSFRWGEEKLRLRLLYREMEETPLGTIRAIAEHQLADTKNRTTSLAASLGGSSTTNMESGPVALVDPVAGRVMEPTQELVSATETILERLRRLVSERGMATSVSDAPIPPVKVSALVPADEVARLEAPGPLDPSGEAVLLLAPPRESLPGRPTPSVSPHELQVAVMREVYPGKYFRLLLGRQDTGHSDVRRLLISQANRDGWFHYAEAVLLDEGYASADPSVRLAALHRMALELTRLVAAIRLHAGDLSVSDAARMFVDEAFLDPATAEREARRVALDPSRMSAALGKLQILKLRRDFLAEGGEGVALEDFHRAFLSCGELPLRLVRLLLLSGGEGETLDD